MTLAYNNSAPPIQAKTARKKAGVQHKFPLGSHRHTDQGLSLGVSKAGKRAETHRKNSSIVQQKQDRNTGGRGGGKRREYALVCRREKVSLVRTNVDGQHRPERLDEVQHGQDSVVDVAEPSRLSLLGVVPAGQKATKVSITSDQQVTVGTPKQQAILHSSSRDAQHSRRTTSA